MITKRKQKVIFLINELYGFGLPYYEYWMEHGEPRTDKIKHEIYSYNIGIGANNTSLYLINNDGQKN
jgi:hypothetical protein